MSIMNMALLFIVFIVAHIKQGFYLKFEEQSLLKDFWRIRVSGSPLGQNEASVVWAVRSLRRPSKPCGILGFVLNL